jgi:hypothetical protein
VSAGLKRAGGTFRAFTLILLYFLMITTRLDSRQDGIMVVTKAKPASEMHKG